MCKICVDLQRERMTTRDARRALHEMSSQLGEDHVEEVREKIEEKERDQQDDG